MALNQILYVRRNMLQLSRTDSLWPGGLQAVERQIRLTTSRGVKRMLSVHLCLKNISIVISPVCLSMFIDGILITYIDKRTVSVLRFVHVVSIILCIYALQIK